MFDVMDIFVCLERERVWYRIVSMYICTFLIFQFDVSIQNLFTYRPVRVAIVKGEGSWLSMILIY